VSLPLLSLRGVEKKIRARDGWRLLEAHSPDMLLFEEEGAETL